MSRPTDKTVRWSLAAALGAAVVASACCTIPLFLVVLGVGGAWAGALTALEPLRPLFVGLAVGALALAGYREWRASRRPDCDCEASVSPRVRRSLLGVGGLVVLALVLSPWIIRGTSDTETGVPVVETGAVQQVVLDVEGMTCASCNVTVQRALTRLEGVEAAWVTFEPPQAVVRFDPSRVTLDELTRATSEAGYPSRPTSDAL
jgi:mercuric transport protein